MFSVIVVREPCLSYAAQVKFHHKYVISVISYSLWLILWLISTMLLMVDKGLRTTGLGQVVCVVRCIDKHVEKSS